MINRLINQWQIQPPHFVRWLFANSLWRMPQAEPTVYLTFDDGPIPEQTPWVLDVLDRYGIKATFFCVGENVARHPDVFADIVARGHAVGNHTFNHVQLFRLRQKKYLENIDKCNAVQGCIAKLFRPPHGQMSPRCAWRLRHLFAHIVFWDVMPFDFDAHRSDVEVFENLKRFTRNGSIIVLHDSLKAGSRMRYALEKGIEFLQNEGYKFGVIE